MWEAQWLFMSLAYVWPGVSLVIYVTSCKYWKTLGTSCFLFFSFWYFSSDHTTPRVCLWQPLFSFWNLTYFSFPNVQSRWIYGFYPWNSSGIGSFEKPVKAIILLHRASSPWPTSLLSSGSRILEVRQLQVWTELATYRMCVRRRYLVEASGWMSVKQREKYGNREKGGRQPGVNACPYCSCITSW